MTKLVKHLKKRFTMKNKYTINELAEIYGIPKSKIRYWEKKNLLKPSRDANNDYRQYDMKQVIELGDIIFFRNIGIPIKHLVTYTTMDYAQLNATFKETKEDIDNQIKQLILTKEALDTKIEKMNLIEHLTESPYEDSQPHFKEAKFNIDNLESLGKIFLNNPYGFSLYFSLNPEVKITEGYVGSIADSNDETFIWEHKNGYYKTALLKVNPDNLYDNNLAQHLAYFKKNGLKVTSVITSYLSTHVDEKRYDFHQAWFEIIQ